VSDYYILSLRWTRSGEEHVTWWGPDNSGYVSSLDNAGRYSAARVHGNRAYYDNRESTVAIPCKVAERHARRIVLTDLADRVVSEAIGEPVFILAPFEHDTDDTGNLVECQECGHESVSKGRSKIVASRVAKEPVA
jgi:DNA-directed RNA polymerase subunit RPC12/RpoP